MYGLYALFTQRSTPSQTSLNRILWFSNHYPYHLRNWIVYRFELFCGCKNLLELHFYSSKLYAICHSYKPYSTTFTWKCIVHWTNHEGKSCIGMFSCVKVLCVTTTIRNIRKKTLNNVTWFCCFFFNSNSCGKRLLWHWNPITAYVILKLDFIIVAWVLVVKINHLTIV